MTHLCHLIWLLRRGPARASSLATHSLPASALPELDVIQAELEDFQRRGIQVYCTLDSGYPANLLEVRGHPQLLFVRGRLLPEDSEGVAVVGTRLPSSRGQARAERLARELAEAGVSVISGLARGVDGCAHMGALAGGGRSLAVIGNGLDHCYPPEHGWLQTRLSREGAVISQFWPEQRPRRSTFPMRNQVMSALARATVVVEAGPESGARLQAEASLRQGRPVVLLTSLVRDFPWAEQFARQPGVLVCSSTRQILDCLKQPLPPRSVQLEFPLDFE